MALQRFNTDYVPGKINKINSLFSDFNPGKPQQPFEDDDKPSGFLDDVDENDYQNDLELPVSED